MDTGQAMLAYARTLWPGLAYACMCGGSASGLPACSEISQPLDFTKFFLNYSG